MKNNIELYIESLGGIFNPNSMGYIVEDKGRVYFISLSVFRDRKRLSKKLKKIINIFLHK